MAGKNLPAGIEIDDAKKIMYVVTKENNSLYIIDLSTKKIIKKIILDDEGLHLPSFTR